MFRLMKNIEEEGVFLRGLVSLQKVCGLVKKTGENASSRIWFSLAEVSFKVLSTFGATSCSQQKDLHNSY